MNQAYPLFTGKEYALAIATVSTGCLLIAPFLMPLEGIPRVILIACILGFFALDVIVLGKSIDKRATVRRKIVAVHGKLVWLFEDGAERIDIDAEMESKVLSALNSIPGYGFEPLSEYVFIWVKPAGSVTYTLGGRTHRCRGLQDGTRIEVEDYQTNALIRHELGHYYISRRYSHLCEKEQHQILSRAGL